MLRRTVLAGGLLAVCAAFAQAAPVDDIQAAVQKLADSPNYSWTTTIEAQFGAGTTDGKLEKGGAVTLTVKRKNQQGDDVTTDIVIDGKKVAVKTADGWKSASELAGGGGGGGGGGFSPERMAMMTARNFAAPSDAAKGMVDKLQNVQKTDDAYTADLSADAVKQLMTFRGRRNANAAPPEIHDAKGTLKVWVKDGVLSKVQNHVTGSMSVNGNDVDIDRTTTTEIKDIGSTVVQIPAEAKEKLEAPPATQPQGN